MKNIDRLIKRLDTVIQNNNDDTDIIPISQNSINNVRLILSSCKDEYLENWNIFPTNLGAISLQYKGKNLNSTIEIGSENISYFIESDLFTDYDLKQFSIENIINILKTVNENTR